MKKVHSLKKNTKTLGRFYFFIHYRYFGLDGNISSNLTSNGTIPVVLGRGSLSVITTFMSFVIHPSNEFFKINL